MSVKDDFYITALERVNLSTYIINLISTRYRYLHSTTQNCIPIQCQRRIRLFHGNHIHLT